MKTGQHALVTLLVFLMGSSWGQTIVRQPNSPRIAFAASEIVREAEAKGAAFRISDSPGSAPNIFLGTYDWVKEIVDAPRPAAVAESFSITVNAPDEIIVAGRDEHGAMYGGLSVAEQIDFGEGLMSVKSKQSQPFLPRRQFKFNLSLGSSMPDWFYSEDFWQDFFSMLARSRFNAVGFWHRHPFPYMIEFERFREASGMDGAEAERRIAMFRTIFRMAKDRGVRTYIINWNVHIPRRFAEAHGLPESKAESPIVRDYMRYCVAKLLKTYPDLTGIGACPGEAMPDRDPEKVEEWMADVFARGIRESGRTVPFLHRAWYTEPDPFKEIFVPVYPGPVYVPLKFNGEHMYTSIRPHFYDERWLETGGSYKVIWHLRNDCIFLLRWGDPEFVRGVVRNCKGDYADGFLMGQERSQPGIENTHTEEAMQHVTWRYEHQRQWFRFMVWGRLGYDPETRDEIFIKHFSKRYGRVGGALYDGIVGASKIIPLTSCFHYNYMNGDWRPEYCWGAWNTGWGRGYNYRDNFGFHDVLEFVFNHTIEDDYLDIPELVGMNMRGEEVQGSISPPTVADGIEASAARARDAALLAEKTSNLQGEALCFAEELKLQAGLGFYYAEKIRTALALMEFIATGDEEKREEAIRCAEAAASHWDGLVSYAEPHFKAATHRRGWANQIGWVRRDVWICRIARPARVELEKLGVFKRSKDRGEEYDFRPVGDIIEETIAPDLHPVNLLGEKHITPENCDVMVMGREAWSFNKLSKEKKQEVLKAVERGVPLVMFFQNYPQFDFGWLPGGINGSDHDEGSFTWIADHPIAKGVNAAEITGRAIANDCLEGGDGEWKFITQPKAVAVRKHGKGWIVLCQIECLGKWRDPEAGELVRNILSFASGKERPKVLFLDEGGTGSIRHLDKMGYSFMWLGDLE